MNEEKKQNTEQLKDDELNEVAGGELKSFPIDINGMIGFDPLDVKLDPKIIPADPSHEFIPKINFDVDPNQRTTRELLNCCVCGRGLVHMVIHSDDNHPTYCPYCGTDLYQFLFGPI